MKNKFLYFFPILIFFLTGCDPIFDIEMVVENNSSDNIQIVSSEFSPNEVTTISPGTIIVIYDYSGVGVETETQLESIVELPFETLQITNKYDRPLNKDVFDLNNWEKVNPDFDGGQARISLIVEDSDFE